MDEHDRRVPVTVLTGFLGAGKTTLLNRLLRSDQLAKTAVIINEAGAIAIDHHLVRDVRGDAIVLGSGCVCCAVSGDLARTLGELYGQAARGEIPGFARVLVETSGLADPTGVLATLIGHPLLARVYRPAAVVTVVDGVLGVENVGKHREAVAQIALADRVVVSKTDVAHDLEPIEQAVRGINRGVEILRAIDVEPSWVMAADHDHGGDHVHVQVNDHDHDNDNDHDHDHDHGVKTFVVVFERPVRMGPLALWLSLMTQMHGGALLRVKGIVNVDGEDSPVVVHCVQHVVYPARQLAAWPDDDRRTRLVFIARGLGDGTIRSLRQSLAETMGQPLVE